MFLHYLVTSFLYIAPLCLCQVFNKPLCAWYVPWFITQTTIIPIVHWTWTPIILSPCTVGEGRGAQAWEASQGCGAHRAAPGDTHREIHQGWPLAPALPQNYRTEHRLAIHGARARPWPIRQIRQAQGRAYQATQLAHRGHLLTPTNMRL